VSKRSRSERRKTKREPADSSTMRAAYHVGMEPVPRQCARFSSCDCLLCVAERAEAERNSDK